MVTLIRADLGSGSTELIQVDGKKRAGQRQPRLVLIWSIWIHCGLKSGDRQLVSEFLTSKGKSVTRPRSLVLYFRKIGIEMECLVNVQNGIQYLLPRSGQVGRQFTDCVTNQAEQKMRSDRRKPRWTIFLINEQEFRVYSTSICH